MLAPARRLLLALVLALGGVVLTQMPAHACKCVSTGVTASAERADVVFSGVLLDQGSTTAGRKDQPATRYGIEADTIYQGDLTSRRVEVVSKDNSCGLGQLETDRPYVFFVTVKGADLMTDQCSGTEKAGEKKISKVEKVLGEGTSVGATATSQEEAEFTRVAAGEASSATRLAAPGVALVLVGLLGLFVVRRRSSRA